jgi:putative addiction module component (TIGR02574 family)
MPATVEQVTYEALSLSETERAYLAQTLLRSLEPEDLDQDEEGVEKAWEAEIARRVEEIRLGTAQGRPAEDVFRDLRARYGW